MNFRRKSFRSSRRRRGRGRSRSRSTTTYLVARGGIRL